MAYTAMASLMNKLIGKLLEDVNLSDEVEDRLWSLLCMLKSLRPFVIEVQRKQSAPEMERLTMDFMELVNEADDAIDSYVTTTSTVLRTEDLRSQIEDIKSKLKIWHNKCPTSTASSSSSVVEDKGDMEDVVGLKNEITKMIERLKDTDPRRDVIPIVGPGGVGKTTLARKVYNHPTTKEIFPCRAWIYASKDYKLPMKKLLQKIINQVSPPSNLPKEDDDHHGAEAAAEDNNHPAEMIILRDLAIKTYKHLKNSGRYLLVFDDVCKTQFWADINMIFPDNKGGGRIIFTTRYHEVAFHARPRRPPFYLRPPLNKEESWQLFIKRVASTSSGEPVVESQSHSQPAEPDHHPWKEWVDACGGLPLAIVELAAEYKRRLQAQSSSVPVDDRVLGIWELIYNNLPLYLKPCLLYLGLLSSCRSSQFKELIIAEGFVQPPTTTKVANQETVAQVEDYVTIAEDYINELLNRNLLEVVSKRWDGSTKEIGIPKVSQLMKFCRDKAKEEIFLEFGDSKAFPQEANRIAIEMWYRDYTGYTSPVISPMKARSLLILEYTTLPSERIFVGRYWDYLLKNYLSLRVLDLFGVDVTQTIPSEIEKLIHLRYLRLNCVGGVTLPSSVCNLWNLLFLRVTNNSSWLSSSEFLLECFWRMRQLKRLLCSDILLLPQPPEDDKGGRRGGGGGGGGNGGGCGGGRFVLNNLQRLKHVAVQCCTEQILSRMPNLVRLGVGGNIQQAHIDEMSKSLPLLEHLQKLGLQGAAKNEIISLSGCKMFPPSITHLTFKRTRLVGNAMQILGKLPNLQVLNLEFNAIEGDELSVNVVDGFRKLKSLKLEQMEIKRWNLSVGAMPVLEILVIRDCSALEGLPSEALQEIQTLRELEVYNYSREAVEKAIEDIHQKRVGKDRLEVRLIKSKMAVAPNLQETLGKMNPPATTSSTS